MGGCYNSLMEMLPYFHAIMAILKMEIRFCTVLMETGVPQPQHAQNQPDQSIDQWTWTCVLQVQCVNITQVQVQFKCVMNFNILCFFHFFFIRIIACFVCNNVKVCTIDNSVLVVNMQELAKLYGITNQLSASYILSHDEICLNLHTSCLPSALRYCSSSRGSSQVLVYSHIYTI